MPIYVKGLRELDRALKQTSLETEKELRKRLKKIAEPVKVGAEERAHLDIRNMTDRWSEMRIGGSGTVVWIRPAHRRTVGPPRKKFGELLLDRAMQPSLDAAEPQVVAGVEQLLDDVVAHNF